MIDKVAELLKHISHRNKLFVFGYIRKKALIKHNLFIPSSIVDFIALYSILMLRWTHTNLPCVTINENGKKVSCIAHDESHYISVTSSTGWQYGKHRWSIQLVQRGSLNADEQIGVVTDYKKAAEYDMWLPDLGHSAYYYACFQSIYRDGGRVRTINILWQEGDIMHLELDCDNWTLKYYLNYRDLGIYKLTPNQKYYPALCFPACQGYQFRIIY